MSTPQQIGAFTRNTLILNGLLNHLPDRNLKPVHHAPAFVHPILIPEDFKKTIANYNRHIYKYNMQLWIDQAEIRKYNKEVISFRKTATVPVEQKIKEAMWKNMMKDHTPEEYNEAVEEYNGKHGPQLRKKNLKQPVKPESEKYFIAFLVQYRS